MSNAPNLKVIDVRDVTSENIQQFIDDLTYGAYRYNRLHRPDIPYLRWASVFGADTVEQCEARFQKEAFATYRGRVPNTPYAGGWAW